MMLLDTEDTISKSHNDAFSTRSVPQRPAASRSVAASAASRTYGLLAAVGLSAGATKLSVLPADEGLPS
ncbi:MAG: hypothetical protein A2289_09005 [Deltaproteobacteria bacterium RIFOXYA12_FULL_58_15]|nr:MAG: hypothetical protein A2289_09005 [Deltaproteobacteria bacterium RIFOXYA12_FULL_58_15]